MDEDEPTQRVAFPEYEQEPTRRIDLPEEEYTRSLDIPSAPPWDLSDDVADLQDEGGWDRDERDASTQRQRTSLFLVVCVLLGLVLGALILVNRVTRMEVTALQGQLEQARQDIADRDARITQLSNELDQSRAAQEQVGARRAALDRREESLHQRERELAQRGAESDIDLPDIDLRGGTSGLSERIRNLIENAVPYGP